MILSFKLIYSKIRIKSNITFPLWFRFWKGFYQLGYKFWKVRKSGLTHPETKTKAERERKLGKDKNNYIHIWIFYEHF